MHKHIMNEDADLSIIVYVIIMYREKLEAFRISSIGIGYLI